MNVEMEIGVRRNKLLPVELEGRGRVLVDVSMSGVPELLKEELVTPWKRRSRKMKGEAPTEIEEMVGLSAGKKSKRGRYNGNGVPFGRPTPNWPDQEFPWVLKTRERKEREEREEVEKLKLIERFLESESEDEEEYGDEEELDREKNFVLDVAKW